MKVIIPLVILFSCYSITYAQKHWEMINNGSYSVIEIQKEAAEYFKNKDKGKGSGYKQYKRWEYFALKDADQNNSINWRQELYLTDDIHLNEKGHEILYRIISKAIF